METVLELKKQDLVPVAPFLSKPLKLFINGEFVEAAPGKTFETTNPATGENLADIALGDADDINKAVAAARKAFDEGPWPKMTPAERQRILYEIGDLGGKVILVVDEG